MVPPAGSISCSATDTCVSGGETTGSGEKPRIWWHEQLKLWCCSGRYMDGWGHSPKAAHDDWCDEVRDQV